VVLQWIVYAARFLTLEELATAIAITPVHTSQEDMRGDMELDLKGLLHAIFGPLLVVGNGGIVNPIHQSTKDFLVGISSERQDNLGSKRHSTTFLPILVSRVKMQILCFQLPACHACPFDTSVTGPSFTGKWSSERQTVIDLKAKYLFLHYAATYWLHYVHCIGYDKMKLSLYKHVSKGYSV